MAHVGAPAHPSRRLSRSAHRCKTRHRTHRAVEHFMLPEARIAITLTSEASSLRRNARHYKQITPRSSLRRGHYSARLDTWAGELPRLARQDL